MSVGVRHKTLSRGTAERETRTVNEKINSRSENESSIPIDMNLHRPSAFMDKNIFTQRYDCAHHQTPKAEEYCARMAYLTVAHGQIPTTHLLLRFNFLSPVSRSRAGASMTAPSGPSLLTGSLRRQR